MRRAMVAVAFTVALSMFWSVGASAGPISPAALTPPSPVCLPRTTPISQAPATEVSDTVVNGTGGRLQQVVLDSPAMGGDENLDVLLPPDYNADPTTRYPTLYLLHGSGGSFKDWVDNGVQRLIDADTTAEGLSPFITVMPGGGLWGYYSDWYGNDITDPTAGPVPAYATYYIDELIPWVDAHYRTIADRQHRAIAGLSMGGFGAMSLAARYPDVFGTAGSFSGAVDTDIDYPAGGLILDGASPVFTDSTPENCVWGDPVTQGVIWHGADPTYLAGNLAHTSLFIAFGNGTPGPYDNTSTAEGAFTAYTDGATEALIYDMNQDFIGALDPADVPFTEYYYGDGTHSWPYWLRDLTHFLPQMNAQFALSSQNIEPGPFSYRSMMPSFTAGGWHFTAVRLVKEFTYLTGVRASGMTVSGSGTLDVVSAPLYLPGESYLVREVSKGGCGTTVQHAVASEGGTIAFTVGLGLSHRVQQTSFGADATEDWTQTQVSITLS
ncbi:MAG: alpha/beta hydrolase [Nitrososphaerales archaeon]